MDKTDLKKSMNTNEAIFQLKYFELRISPFYVHGDSGPYKEVLVSFSPMMNNGTLTRRVVIEQSRDKFLWRIPLYR